MRGPGIILLTNTKSPGIMVGDIDHVGMTNEANRNTRNAIAKIIENINTRNQPSILFRMRLIFDLFDLSPCPSPQGRGEDSAGATIELSSNLSDLSSNSCPQGRGEDSAGATIELSSNFSDLSSNSCPQGMGTKSDWLICRLFFRLKNFITVM
jgi:hypothetical protein